MDRASAARRAGRQVPTDGASPARKGENHGRDPRDHQRPAVSRRADRHARRQRAAGRDQARHALARDARTARSTSSPRPAAARTARRSGPTAASTSATTAASSGTSCSGLTVPGNQPADYIGGRIQRVDLATGKVEDALHGVRRPPAARPERHRLRRRPAASGSPTTARSRERDRDRSGVYYARADGSLIREVIYPARLAERRRPLARRQAALRRRDLHRRGSGRGTSPRRARSGRHPPFAAPAARCSPACPASSCFDSLAVDAEGNVCVATLVNGGITVVSPDGSTSSSTCRCPTR